VTGSTSVNGIVGMTTFPCPSCGTERGSDRAACDRCGWPRIPASVTPDDPQQHDPIQSTRRSLLVLVAVVCIVFAIVSRYGIKGFFELLDAVFLLDIPILLLVEVYFRWIRNDMEGT
jgi:hypothetical protein